LVLVGPAVVNGQSPFTLLSVPRLRVLVAALLSAYLWFSFALQHGVLRLLLARVPSRFPLAWGPWLQRWDQRRVLRRWGGAYGFLHETLRETLAKD
jgi:hypothetical protein